MEKLKQKVALLQENITTSRDKIQKTETEMEAKTEKIESLSDSIDTLVQNIAVSEDDLEHAEDELLKLKTERKRLNDEEEEKDRHLRKLQRSTDQSKEGSENLIVKNKKNQEKLDLLLAEIEEKEKNIDTYENDLEMAEENNNTLKDELNQLNSELAETTAQHQSLSSSRVTTSGAGGNLQNQVTQKKAILSKRKEELSDMEERATSLLNDRDQIEDDILVATKKLEEIKLENAQLLDDLENL